jgi:D-3-phosphoglycerate dehydrogenase
MKMRVTSKGDRIMSFKVVHTYALPGVDHGDALLESLDATLVKGVWLNEDEIIINTKDADAIIGVVSRQPFNRRVFKTLRNCRIIAGIAIGFEAVDLAAATEFKIAVTNVPDYCLDEVSGLAIGFMLALGHIMLQIDKVVRERQINFTGGRQAIEEIGYPIFRMRDQTLGIVGLGKIGTATALKARGLGIRVIAYDPYVLDGVMESHGVKPVDFDTLLRESDFISIHTPLTPETHNMFGYEEFKKMKPTCYFINTARGRCVDEPALIKALQEGLIAGAGIDVTVEEPIAADNPLIKMPNVILTGHSAFYSTTSDGELFYKPMTQVAMALKGEWPQYGLNPEVKEAWLHKWGTVA